MVWSGTKQLPHVDITGIEEVVGPTDCRSYRQIDHDSGIVNGRRSIIVEGEASSEFIAQITDNGHVWRHLAHLVGDFTRNESTVHRGKRDDNAKYGKKLLPLPHPPRDYVVISLPVALKSLTTFSNTQASKNLST